MSLNERVAAYLRAREGQWVDGWELARVGGYAAWRWRVSDLRKPPYNLVIENKVTVVTDGSRRFKVSEYRLIDAAQRP